MSRRRQLFQAIRETATMDGAEISREVEAVKATDLVAQLASASGMLVTVAASPAVQSERAPQEIRGPSHILSRDAIAHLRIETQRRTLAALSAHDAPIPEVTPVAPQGLACPKCGREFRDGRGMPAHARACKG